MHELYYLFVLKKTRTKLLPTKLLVESNMSQKNNIFVHHEYLIKIAY